MPPFLIVRPCALNFIMGMPCSYSCDNILAVRNTGDVSQRINARNMAAHTRLSSMRSLRSLGVMLREATESQLLSGPWGTKCEKEPSGLGV